MPNETQEISKCEGEGAPNDHERPASSPRSARSLLPRSLAEILGVTVQSERGREDFNKGGGYVLRRLFAELFGTFLLVLVAAGGGVVNARFGGHAVPASAQVVAPGLMVMAIILFMGRSPALTLTP